MFPSLSARAFIGAEDVDAAVRYCFGFRYVAAGPITQKELAGLETQLNSWVEQQRVRGVARVAAPAQQAIGSDDDVLAAIEHAAHHLEGALVGQEFPHLLLEELLVVREIEVHDTERLA